MSATQAFSRPSSRPSATRSQGASSGESSELDRFAREFAYLVRQYRPHRGDEEVVAWMRSLPDEAFRYYRQGIRSYGRGDTTAPERRGRLYLTHTALLFMWMSWGKSKARERFRKHAREATRRVANLVMLEKHRRAGVITDYSIGHWFWSPVEQWGLVLDTSYVDPAQIGDENLADAIQTLDTVAGNVDILATLRQDGALKL